MVSKGYPFIQSESHWFLNPYSAHYIKLRHSDTWKFIYDEDSDDSTNIGYWVDENEEPISLVKKLILKLNNQKLMEKWYLSEDADFW